MYTLVSAIGKSFASQGRWVDVDIGDMPLYQIYATYVKVYAVLTNPFVDGQVSLDLSQIQATDGGLSITFNEFLTENSDTVLPTSTTIPTLSARYAEYKDARRAGYKVQPINATAAPDAQLPLADKTWLYLTKVDNQGKSIDFDLWYKSMMVTINGFFHRIDATPTGGYVVDGMLSNFKCHQNLIGLLNFQNLGTLTYVPITEAMIYKQSSDQLYRNQMHINLGQDITNKTVLLSLGGYLSVLDGKTMSRVGTQTVRIDFNNLPVIERFHESLPYLDFSALPYQKDPNDESLIVVADFLSDANLVAYATMSQSFFVILDNSEVFLDYEYPRVGNIVNKLTSFVEPKYPLITGLGKVADYWSVEEDKQWAITVYDNKYNNRTYDTIDLKNAVMVNNARQSQDVVRHSRAYFLKIGTDFDSNTTP
ncbi:hypothetical protein [Burkholderia phage FLC9]|nr:hypothetical protein [Burkholderia phage FLC9]